MILFPFKVTFYLNGEVDLIILIDNSIRSSQKPQLCVKMGTIQRLLDEQALADRQIPYRILNALDVPLGQTARSMDGLT
jgi:hypothetical protein